MIKFKSLLFCVSIALVAGFGFVGGSFDTGMKGFVSFHEAQASPYRRSVRRTSRRTARRTSRRHGGYYGGVGAAAVAGAAVVTAVAVGTIVATLPPSCTTVVSAGVTYQNCSGTWYRPQGSQYIVVNAP